MTIAELRQRDKERLAEMLGGNLDEAHYIMNCFYRMAGLYSRICIIENDADLYERYTRHGWLDEEETRLERMISNINKHLAPVGLMVHNESACSSIVRPDIKSHCIAETFTLGHWYR